MSVSVDARNLKVLRKFSIECSDFMRRTVSPQDQPFAERDLVDTFLTLLGTPYSFERIEGVAGFDRMFLSPLQTYVLAIDGTLWVKLASPRDEFSYGWAPLAKGMREPDSRIPGCSETLCAGGKHGPLKRGAGLLVHGDLTHEWFSK